MKNDTWSQLLRRLSANLAVRISEGIAPIINGALAYLQDLKLYCPEAFDDAGSLRPDWQEIVRAKLAEMQTAKTPELHSHLITRKKVVNVN